MVENHIKSTGRLLNPVILYSEEPDPDLEKKILGYLGLPPDTKRVVIPLENPNLVITNILSVKVKEAINGYNFVVTFGPYILLSLLGSVGNYANTYYHKLLYHKALNIHFVSLSSVNDLLAKELFARVPIKRLKYLISNLYDPFDGGKVSGLGPDISLLDFQKAVLPKALSKTGYLIAHFTGSGKTYSSCGYLSLLKERFPELKFMVVCQRHLNIQWMRKMGLILPGVKKVSIYDPMFQTDGIRKLPEIKARQNAYDHFFSSSNFDVLIASYSSIVSDIEKFVLRVKDLVVIFDEATDWKHEKTKLHDTVKLLASKAVKVLALTATPLTDHLEELYGIFAVVKPGLFSSLREFKARYFIRKLEKVGKKRFWKTTGYKNLDQLRLILKPYMDRVTEEDVPDVDIPKLMLQEVVLDMYEEQKKLYFREESRIFNGDLRMSAIEKLYNCLEVSASPTIKGRGTSKGVKEDHLMNMLHTVLDGKKGMVFAPLKVIMDQLETRFTREKVGYYRIDGDVSIKKGDRQKIIDAFWESKEHNVLLVNHATRFGVDLEIGEYVVFYALSFSLDVFLQIIGRIKRVNSKHKINRIFVLNCDGSIDSYIYSVIQKKLEVQERFYGSKQIKEATTVSVDSFSVQKEVLNLLRKKYGGTTGFQPGS